MHTLNTGKLTHAGSIYIFVIIPNVLNLSLINYLLETVMHINQTKAHTPYFIQLFCGCVILPLETLPPSGDPNGRVVYLKIVLFLMGNS
jgi:hypothetical protein